MTVAIIMSIYKSDAVDNIRIAVDSVLNQSYSDIRLFLFRDGPVDENIQHYINELSSNDRVEIIGSDFNIGLASALNNLIDVVLKYKNIRFIARMDSDDISREERIARQVEFMSAHPEVDVSGTSCHEFGASFAMTEKHLPAEHSELIDFSITRCPFIHPSVMFRREVFEQGHRYPTNTALTEDMLLWLKLLSHGLIFANLNEVLLDYRLSEATIKRRAGLKKAFSEVLIRTKYMFILRRWSMKNFFLITSRFLFHLLPPSIMAIAYKTARKEYTKSKIKS